MPRPRKSNPDDPHFTVDPDLFDPEAKHLQHVVLLRSEVAHGELLAVSHPLLPPEVRLILPEHLPGAAQFSVYKGKLPLLAGDTVQYRGEPVGLLVGPDRQALKLLAAQFDFVIRKKSMSMSGADEGPFRTRQLTRGEPPADDRPDLQWVEGSYSSGSQDAYLTTPLTVTAVPKNGEIYLHLPTQWPSLVVQAVARALDLEPAKVHVEPLMITAHADSLVWFPALLACHAAVAAQAAGKPVSLHLDKDEEFYFAPKRPEARFSLRTALDASGQIRFMKARISVNFGAWALFDQEILDRILIALLGVYKIPGWQFTAQADRSHTPPRGPVGGYGEALALAALENHSLDLAEAAGLTPLDFKLLNLQGRDNTWLGGHATKDPVPLVRLAENLALLTDYRRKQAAFHLLHQKRREFFEEILPRRGIGLALGFQGNGFTSADLAPASLEVRLETNGKVYIYCGLLSSTTRLFSRWKKLVSSLLTVPERDVRFCKVHSGALPDAGPSTASRSLEMVEKVLIQCCEAIAAKRFRQPLPLVIKRPFRRVKHLHWDDETFSGIPFVSVTWGSCLVELEVNPVQAQLAIKRVVMLIEAGEIQDEKAARTAVLQGVQLGLGWTLLESLAWENHRLARSAFLKYRVPTLRDLPPVDIRFLPSEKYQPPKGLGDIGCQLIAAGVVAAFRQAVHQKTRSLPLTRKIIDDALRSYEN